MEQGASSGIYAHIISNAFSISLSFPCHEPIDGPISILLARAGHKCECYRVIMPIPTYTSVLTNIGTLSSEQLEKFHCNKDYYSLTLS